LNALRFYVYTARLPRNEGSALIFYANLMSGRSSEGRGFESHRPLQIFLPQNARKTAVLNLIRCFGYSIGEGHWPCFQRSVTSRLHEIVFHSGPRLPTAL